jgi:hypothetical protein
MIERGKGQSHYGVRACKRALTSGERAVATSVVPGDDFGVHAALEHWAGGREERLLKAGRIERCRSPFGCAELPEANTVQPALLAMWGREPHKDAAATRVRVALRLAVVQEE